MLDRAIAYATYGWSVFPCHSIRNGTCSCGKGAGCTSPGKHPRTVNGVKDATTNHDLITRWWTQWPDANIALACGRQTGLFVIDIDPRKNGFESIETYEQDRGEPLPTTLTALTGGGGRHLFYLYPRDVTIGNRNNWLPGVDVKSDGGYVILTPGSHISGGTYSWRNLGEVAPVLAPLDVVSDIRGGGSGSSNKEPVSDAASILSGIEEGRRDDTLFRWACRLRRQHSTDDDGGRAVVEALVLQAAAVADPPFPRDQAIKCVDSAFKQDHDDTTWDWGMVTTEGEPLHHLTDLGNAHRFADAFAGNLCFATGIGWLVWTDIGWNQISAEEMANQLAYQVPTIVRGESVRAQDDPRLAQALRKWALQTESAGHLSAIERLARNLPSLLHNAADFDADPYALACANGIVDLRTGELRPLTPDDRTTKSTGVMYRPDARLGVWEDFLRTATDGDEELQRYLQRAAGYTLTGSNAMECFFVVSGLPASGKSTFIDALQNAAGTYATATQSDTFMYKRGQTVRSDELARFAGKRMVTVSEIRQGESFHESLVKQFTGDDLIVGRQLYQKAFEFRPQMKLWIVTNYDPDTRDRGMWRRLRRIAFNHVIPKEQRDPRIKEMLRDPMVGGQAVLAWAVQGAIEWCQTNDLAEPVSVTAATMDYYEEQDRFQHFVTDVIEPVPGEQVSVRELYGAYRMWCSSTGERPIMITQFGSELRSRGLEVIVAEPRRQKVVAGVRIRTPQTSLETGMSWS